VRIAVNTLSVTDHNEGIRTMIVGLVGALVRNDPVNRYRLICSRANYGLFAALAESGLVDATVLDEHRRRPLVRILRDQVTVPRLVRREADLLVTPSTVGSLFAPVPQVVIMVAHLALPSVRHDAGGERLSAWHRAYYGPLMRVSHRRADAVVAISDFLAQRLVADTRLPAGKVHAIPCGSDPVDARPRPVEPDAGPPAPYLLFVSTLYPYKNADCLVRALAQARPRLAGGRGDGLRAVIVGRDPDGRQIPGLRRLAAELGVADDVMLAGKVGDDELERLYAGASALVFPSRAEGFGFAALEAMARGIPVIAADRTSLPEVVAGAGLLFDPDRPETLADAIVRLVGDDGLRATLVEAGRARAAELSWNRAAAAFIDLFGRLARA
jgi:glycosyltransferase involved in cell wall biosynthesis